MLTDQQLPEPLNLKANLIHSQHLAINEFLQRHGLEQGFSLLLTGHWSDPRALQIALSTAQRVPCCMQALGQPLRSLRQCTVSDSDSHEGKWKSLSPASGCSVDAAMTAALSELDNISSSKEHLTLYLTNLCLWQEFSKTPRSGDTLEESPFAPIRSLALFPTQSTSSEESDRPVLNVIVYSLPC